MTTSKNENITTPVIRINDAQEDSYPPDIQKYAKEHNIRPDYLVIWRWPNRGLVIAIDYSTGTCYLDIKQEKITKFHTNHGWDLDKIWPTISNILLDHNLICKPLVRYSAKLPLPDLGSP